MCSPNTDSGNFVKNIVSTNPSLYSQMYPSGSSAAPAASAPVASAPATSASPAAVTTSSPVSAQFAQPGSVGVPGGTDITATSPTSGSSKSITTVS